MNKYEFLFKLTQSLETTSLSERQEIVRYYDELIQDALDNGETEADFIDRLGSIDKITRTIKKDSDFKTNVKEKKDYQLRSVFSIGVKIIGYFIYFVLFITVLSIGVSFVGGGGSALVFSVIRLYYAIQNDLAINSILLYSGNIAVGLGLMLLGIWMLGWLGKKSKNQLEKLLEFIQSKIKKEEE